jgi:hypothetical protein
MDRDWDKELAKIDRQLEKVSDEAMFPTPKGATTVERKAVAETRRRTSTLGAMVRLLLAIALAVAVGFWPYPTPCGWMLAGYLAAVAAVIGAGGWSAVWTWRHRTGRAHLLSLLVVLWGLVLGAKEVLPRVPWPQGALTPARTWLCR